MKSKEEESQALYGLYFQITLMLIVWFGLVMFGWYRIQKLKIVPKLPLTSIPFSIPSLKENNLQILRGSIKEIATSSSGIVSRIEPFD